MWHWGFNVGRHEFLVYWHRTTGAKGIRLISYPHSYLSEWVD